MASIITLRRKKTGASENMRAMADLTAVVAAQQQELGALKGLLADLAQGAAHDRRLLQRISDDLVAHRTSDLQRLLDGLRVVRDRDEPTRARLLAARAHPDYNLAYTGAEPLVSVIIATYRGADTLRDRTLPSVLSQTYANLEVIVVGDGDPPGVRAVVEGFGDARLHYATRPYRGPYPSNPDDAWMVSGTPPLVDALRLAHGRWTAPLGDDDAFHPRHVEQLLALARAQRAEVAYGLLMQQVPGGAPPVPIGRFPPEHAHFGLQATLMHGHLRFLEPSSSDFLFRMPNDWTLAERMLRIGVRFSMLNAPTADYYPSLDYGAGLHVVRKESFDGALARLQPSLPAPAECCPGTRKASPTPWPPGLGLPAPFAGWT